MKKIVAFSIIFFALGCSKENNTDSNSISNSSNTTDTPLVFTPIPLDSFCIINNDTFYYESKCPYRYSKNDVIGKYLLNEVIYIDSCSKTTIKGVFHSSRYRFEVYQELIVDGSEPVDTIDFYGNSDVNGYDGRSELTNSQLALNIRIITDAIGTPFDYFYESSIMKRSLIYDKGKYLYKYNENAILKFEKL